MARNRIFAGVGLLLGAVLPLSAAWAAEEGTLEEVVVTAQKRTETVQSVPLSITVVSSEELTRQGVTSIADLSRASASLEFGAPGTSSPGGGGYVRGIGTNSFGYTAQASVGIVLDGVVMGNANLLNLFDIQRVEILKGPQGTLFGNAVSAGVINIATNAPDLTKRDQTVAGELAGNSLGSDYSRYMLRTTLNLPINEYSALRFSARTENNQGVFRDTFSNSDSVEPDNGFRLRYLARPSDAVTINLIADYDRATSQGHPALTYRSAPAGSPLAQALSDCGVTPSTSNFNMCSEIDNRTSDLVRGASAQFDVKLADNLNFTSITAWRGRDSDTRQDIETIPVAISSADLALGTHCHFFDCVPIYAIRPGGNNGLQTHNASQWSEEARLASIQSGAFEWVAGVFYQGFKNDINEPGNINAVFTGGQFSPTGKFASVKTTDYAGFANGTFHFSDTLRGIVGMRYTHSDVNENATDITVAPPTNNFYLDTTASKFSYRVGLQLDVARQVMGYATISTGYKGPQISDDISGGNVYAVKPEVPTNYEIGVKASAFGNRLAVDADVFYMEVKDYQGQNCTPNSQGTITCVPTNVSSVTSKGVEVDIFGNPVAGLTLNISGIYNPAEYPKGYLSADGSNLGGTQLTRSSKEKVTFSGEYDAAIGNEHAFVIGVDAVYRSAQSIYPSASQTFVVSGDTILNARLGFKSGKEWGIYLFGRNLSDTHFPRDLFPTPFQTGGVWQAFDAADRRIVGVQFDTHF